MINVLSLFDGMSCGQLALQRAGIKYDKYYAAEIDKYAVAVTQANHPSTVQLGDVERWRYWPINWADVDLLIGGSPCQGFSFAGKQQAFDDPRSRLFFTFVEIRDFINTVRKSVGKPPVKFLLENVKMKKDHLHVISGCLGVQPALINSALVSAQNRQRYYWANWDFDQPEDTGVMLADILEKPGVVGRVVNRRLDPSTGRHSDYSSFPNTQLFEPRPDNKSGALTTVGKDNMVGVGGRWDNRRKAGDEFKEHEVGKANTITATYISGVDKYDRGARTIIRLPSGSLRPLTPLECERLQTAPDNYTAVVSKTQRYKMLGNGWTVDVIAHILRALT